MDAETELLRISGIECVAGGRRIVIAQAAIDQIVECTIAPLPLARTWIGGLAAHHDELVVSVRLAATAAEVAPEGRRAKAVLLVARAEGQARWSVEIDAVTSFVDATIERSRFHEPTAQDGRAPWLVSAQTAGGEVDWLDVDRMLHDLSDGRAA